MTNAFRNEVSVTLNGTEYLLRPTFETLVKIEDETGQTIAQLLASTMTLGLKAKHALAILRAGIEGAEQKPNISELKDNMLAAGLPHIIEAVGAFLTAALNAGDEAGKG